MHPKTQDDTITRSLTIRAFDDNLGPYATNRDGEVLQLGVDGELIHMASFVAMVTVDGEEVDLVRLYSYTHEVQHL